MAALSRPRYDLECTVRLTVVLVTIDILVNKNIKECFFMIQPTICGKEGYCLYSSKYMLLPNGIYCLIIHLL